MKKLLSLFCLLSLLTSALGAPSPISLTVATRNPGFEIPEDYAGLSFETWAAAPDRSGVKGYLFSPTNAQLITLFTNSSIRNLRIGGCTVDGLEATVPSRADIDSLFGFARAAGIKVIYSLRLLNGDAADAAATAQYIWTHYQPCLRAFSIGNEPNQSPYASAPVGAITNYAGYLAAWRSFADAIQQAVPGASFTGPEAGGSAWVAQFAQDESHSGRVVWVTGHQYAGGKPFVPGRREYLPASAAIDGMLSRNWATDKYVPFYNQTLALVATNGLRYRMTEANDYLHGIDQASNAFASALWALDCLHWWAARGCAGIDFHNNQHREWLPTDTIYLIEPTQEYRIHPKAYAFKAFALGSHGWTQPVAIGNAAGLNLTAYAVGGPTNLCVTIINKEHGAGAREAAVVITPEGSSFQSAEVLFLNAANGEPGATHGITLGGQPIRNDAPWRGQWTKLHPAAGQAWEVVVPAVSAVVVKLSVKPSFAF